MGFDPKARIGVVALSNTSTAVGVDDIGRHLLDASVPLAPAPKLHKEVPVDPKIFDGYVGTYAIAHECSFSRLRAMEITSSRS